MSIYRGPGGAGDATNDASSQASLVAQKVAEAQASADSASGSASAASSSASAASSSASAASTSASNAATSASNASTSATSAASSATAAASSASDAATSASEASSDASAAATSAAEASSSASTASTSATNASNSATAAASSASDASTSASAASASASSASSSATAAAASLDSFDDRYLGAKSSNPSVDNDGNALLTGAIYWNTTSNEFRVWSGSTWVLFSGIPDQTGNSGKFLATNGTSVSWNNLPEASTTSGGIVYGLTSSQAGIVYTGWSDYVTPYILFDAPSNVFFAQTPVGAPSNNNIIVDWNSWVSSTVSVGDPIYGQLAGGSKLYYGVVTSITGGTSSTDPAFIYVSDPNSNPAVSFVYPTNFTFSSPYTVSDGNTSLGYQSNSSGGKNTIIGYGAGSTISSGYNLTVIGYDSEPSSSSAVNETTLGNSATTNTRLFGSLSLGGSSAGTSGQVLTSSGSGTAPTWTTPTTGTVTAVTGTSPVASSGGNTPAISLAAAYGDTLNPYASKTANYVLAAPNGSSGVPTFRAIVAADIPTLNQNTTGTASNITGTVAVANGGTGQTTATDAFNALAPSQASNSGKYLTTDGTNTSWTNTINGGTF